MWDEACTFETELTVFRDNLAKFEEATDGERCSHMCVSYITHNIVCINAQGTAAVDFIN